MKRFHSPKTVIARFVAKRTIRSATLWALFFAIYVASKAIGFVDTYPTAVARQKVAETFSNNVGIELMLGKAPRSGNTGAYVAWNTLAVMVIFGSIWAVLLAAKYFRGEEDTGRWELMLAGQSTARGAAMNNLAGLGSSLVVFFAILAIAFSAIGRSKGVDFTTSAAMFLALATVLGIVMFLLIGALASEIMPTRGRAAAVATTVLAISFILKAIGDVTSFNWAINISPLGWVENLKPLDGSHLIWLVPIILSCLILAVFTIYVAGKRDLGAGIISDQDSKKANFRLLGSPYWANLRLTRSNITGWLTGITVAAVLYGLMTKSAAQAFSQSKGAKHLLNSLAHQAQHSTILIFLGVVFLLQMTIIMAYVASAVSAARREEAEGLLDNFLVRPYSRLKWIGGRLMLIILVALSAGALTFISLFLATAYQHDNIATNLLLGACVNALVPAAITLGIGVLAFGFIPRMSAFFAYGVIVWSFLISILSSGISINHWILDTSVLNQIVLAPAVNPNWATDIIVLLIAAILCLIGVLRFNRRDLASL
jgi:ABC-2 type transport system permease protein